MLEWAQRLLETASSRAPSRGSANEELQMATRRATCKGRAAGSGRSPFWRTLGPGLIRGRGR